MGNRDMPSNSELTHERCGDVSQSKTSGGLTKLEYAAIAVIQGLITHDLEASMSTISKMAIAQANSLFDELEKSNGV